MTNQITRCLLVSILTLAGSHVFGQKDIATDFVYGYELLENNPEEDYPALNFFISPFTADILMSNIGLGGEVKIDYTVKNKFTINAMAYMAYVDMADTRGDRGIRLNEGTAMNNSGKRAFRSEVSIGYRIKKMSKTGITKVKIGGRGRTMYVLAIEPTKIYKSLNVRVGYGYENSAQTANYATFRGVRVNALQVQEQALTGSNYQTMSQNHYITFGASYVTRKKANVKVWRQFKEAEPKSIGKKHAGHQTTLYADLLISVKTDLANMSVQDDNYNEGDPNYLVTYELNPYTFTLPVGIRVGYEHSYIFRRVGLTYGPELGVRPGKVGTSGVYLQMKVGIRIGAM